MIGLVLVGTTGCSSNDEMPGGSGGQSGSGGSGASGGTSGSGGASGGTSGSGGSGGSGGTSGSAGSGGSGATVKVSGRVTEFAAPPADGGAPPPPPALEGVEVCVLDEPAVPCATTAAEGHYMLPGVPANVVESGLTFVKSGFLSTAGLISTGTVDLNFDLPIPSESLASAFASILGTTYPDPENGVVSFNVYTSGAGTTPDGFSVSISPASGAGPFYTSDLQVPDKSLTVTSKSGAGFFTGLPPGAYEITFTHPTKTSCQRATTGWVSSKQNSLKVRTLANFLVICAMACD